MSLNSPISRRDFLAQAAILGAGAAWVSPQPLRSRRRWTERRDLFPHGVASGDPSADGAVLWTRRPGTDRPVPLVVEVSEDPEFTTVVASARVSARAENDWTVRVLVGGLSPAHEYWYRFTDEDGGGSRIGRTITAPADGDARPVRFAFVSCQDVTIGSMNAYRRMLYEDRRAAPADRLGFVLHLGDFVYEVVQYPDEAPKYGERTVREVFRYPHGENIGRYYIPVDLEDYRTVYRGYLADPDLQDIRAHLPFVCMWDNHEFSWNGWQSIQNFGKGPRAAQTRKVAANQAWWEFQPARVATPHRTVPASLEAFDAPAVSDEPITRFDDHGLGQEPNNIAAIESLTGYRAFRYGRNLELLITDQRSYRSEEPTSRPEADGLSSPDFPGFMPEEAMAVLDAGRAWGGGAPATIRFGDETVPNYRREEPPQTILGAKQKAWFLDRLRASKATWKVWGNSMGVLDWRADPQHLPPDVSKPWPGAGYAGFGGGDPSSAYTERREIYDVVEKEGITGFACVAGDRHTFWAGLMAATLPGAPTPQGPAPRAAFKPVGVAFITGSISSVGLVEAYEGRFPKQHPLRSLYLIDRPDLPKPEPAVNILLRHGVRACLDYATTRSLTSARAKADPDLSPHLSFLDLGGHGYAAVRVDRSALECEFVCIPRPLTRDERADGGPMRYRVSHRAALWRRGERPRLEQRVLEGDPGLGA